MEEEAKISAPTPTTPVEPPPPDEEQVTYATPLQMMWWRFRRHKMAIFGAIILILFYFVMIFADFFAPYDPAGRTPYMYSPPQTVHFVDNNGNFSLTPLVYGIGKTRNMETLELIYVEDKTKEFPIQFFVHSWPYDFLGLIPADLHLFGAPEGADIFLLGTDHLARDMVSRIIFGARISLTIGLVGVFMSMIIGLIIGGISALYGGWLDNVIQRVIEVIISIPSLPLLMGLSAAIPRDWTIEQTYFVFSLILSLISTTVIIRIVRGKFLSTRNLDFITAARLYGSSEWRIIMQHLIPSFLSYVIVRVTLDIPRMILSETALSFLGIGLRPPSISWGVLLTQAQNYQTVVIYPWLLLPAVFVIIAVLAFSFMGDGLRDAADPFSTK
jgi:peptide/nickel transport system permease protein